LTRGTTTYSGTAPTGGYTNFPISFTLAGTTNPITINAPSAASQADPRGTAGGSLANVVSTNPVVIMTGLQLNDTLASTFTINQTVVDASGASHNLDITFTNTSATTWSYVIHDNTTANAGPDVTGTTTYAVGSYSALSPYVGAVGAAAGTINFAYSSSIAPATGTSGGTATVAASAIVNGSAKVSVLQLDCTNNPTPISSTVTDSNGVTHDLNITFTNTGANKWSYVIHETIPSTVPAGGAINAGADVTGSVTYDPTNGYSSLATFTGISGGTVAFTID
uniref:hypothetical protein n=1 Tax=Pelosinus sp. sgz500959 TaxID=3242472 RepID=UPI00366B324E